MDDRVKDTDATGINFTPEQHRSHAIRQYKSMDANNAMSAGIVFEKESDRPMRWGGDRYTPEEEAANEQWEKENAQ